MDGKELLYQLRQALNEQSDSRFLDTKTSYMYLWRAATEFVMRTNSLTATQSITTVANQSEYTLSYDFIKSHVKNGEERSYIKYTQGSNITFIYWRDYDRIIYDNLTTSVSVPSYFSIKDQTTMESQVSSTATSAGASSGGECTLTDSTAPFANVNPGDTVHNITDGSDGIVLSKTSSSVIVTALFGGTNNDWTSADSYVIQPSGKLAIILSPPPQSSGDTITVYYVKAPDPVFSSYRAYKFQEIYMDVIVKYAAWLYAYKDSKPDYGDKWYSQFELQTRRIVGSLGSAFNRSHFTVNFRKK